jgi:hypothetical protein
MGMVPEFQGHLDKILEEYTSGQFFNQLIEARDEYFGLTGVINEEDHDYEAKMNSFNDWYIFHYLNRGSKSTILNDYLEKNSVDEAVARSLRNVTYSLFEVLKVGKVIKLKDILRDKKLELAKDHRDLGCVEGDLFTGRIVSYDKQIYLLSGMCTLPRGTEKILKREVKKIRKAQDPNLEMKFLLQLELFKIKWLRYSHLDLSRIFDFSNFYS